MVCVRSISSSSLRECPWYCNSDHFSRSYVVEHFDKWQENTSAGPSSNESNQFNLEILCEESSCNHREKEIVFENLISFLYQIAPIKCKWCEIISFLFCVLPFLWAELCKIVGWLKLNVEVFSLHLNPQCLTCGYVKALCRVELKLRTWNLLRA